MEAPRRVLDVSVVLTVHREARYLTRTMKSLSECAAFAAYGGIRSELVLVLDRSDIATRGVAAQFEGEGFERIVRVEADKGCAGGARNAGIEHAAGDYIWFADADDLVSYNCLAALHGAAQRERETRLAIFPEYLVAFGEAHWVARYYGDEVVESADFVFGHPFTSRLFTHRNAFRDLRFSELPLTTGFGYEDWHLNCELRGRGYRFQVAARTIIFYRQRQGSLLRQTNAISVRQPPHSLLFAPEVLPALVDKEKAARDEDAFQRRRSEARHGVPRDTLISDDACVELMAAACSIDPGIDVRQVEAGGNWVNAFPDRHVGHAYVEVLRKVGCRSFTDFVLAPPARDDHDDRYMVEVLTSLGTLHQSFNALVFAAERLDDLRWEAAGGGGFTRLDLDAVCPELNAEDKGMLAFRLALAVAGSARLHLAQSEFGMRFFRAYEACLGSMEATFYRAVDPRECLLGTSFELGRAFDFLSSHLPAIRSISCDSLAIAESDRKRIGLQHDKWVFVPAAHAVHSLAPRGALSGRLLWTSAPSRALRADLLGKLADGLARDKPEVTIVFSGEPSSDIDFEALLHGRPNLRYRGVSRDFGSLEGDSYDALLFTASSTGRPTAVLNAMSRGLPVIAPAVGGIPEVVIDGATGFLVPDVPDDDLLVAGYLGAISRFYSGGWIAALRLGETAQAFVREHHSPVQHRRSVHRLFFGTRTA